MWQMCQLGNSQVVTVSKASWHGTSVCIPGVDAAEAVPEATADSAEAAPEEVRASLQEQEQDMMLLEGAARVIQQPSAMIGSRD